MNNEKILIGGYEVEKEGLNAYIAKVFGWTFLGILITALTSIFFIFGAAFNPAIASFLLIAQPIVIVSGIIVIIFSFVIVNRINTMNPSITKAVYIGYSISIGSVFSILALVFPLDMIGAAFLITSVTFGVMAVYGLITKTDLTSMGTILLGALVGLIIAIIVNMFIGNSMLDFIISVAGVFIFLGLTAWDSQRIKLFYAQTIGESGESSRASENLAIMSALTLYINFINLFRFILSLLSRD